MNAAIKKSRSTLSIDNSQFSVVYLRYSCLALNIEHLFAGRAQPNASFQ
jgi:hypothetical protein